MSKSLNGVLVALSTPFTVDDQIDIEGLRAHIDAMLDAGMHGLVPGGSTGEFQALSMEERKLVNQVAVEQAAGRVPVVAGVGANRTEDAVELAVHAAEIGADAILVVAPYYETPTRQEVLEYFAEIGNRSGLPIVAYNLPASTGINQDREFYDDLMKLTDKLAYVKDTSGDLEQAIDLILNAGDKYSTFVGWDTMVLNGLEAGGDGTIWGTPNFAPKECVEIYELVKSGRVDEARVIFNRIWNVMKFLGSVGYTVAVKEAAEIAGFKVGAPRRPYSPLPDEERERLRGLMKEAGLTK